MAPDDTALAHQPVMLQEVLDALQPSGNRVLVDGTFGRGGHSRALLARLGSGGTLLAVDRDHAAIAAAEALAASDPRVQVARGNFADLADLVAEAGLQGRVDGLLLDLGVSSPQLDDAGRGFSFAHDGPLDMRMDQRQARTAADWVNTTPVDEMARVFRDYGEERFARRVARAIEAARAEAPFERTAALAEVVAAAKPHTERRLHPATRVFQAIRIAVNGELEALEQVLAALPQVLAPGGRAAIISFHSLEDRLVKRTLRKPPPPVELRRLPVRDGAMRRGARPVCLRGGLVRPGEAETRVNPRARSARLRIAERVV